MTPTLKGKNMGRTAGGRHAKLYTIRCAWCGEAKETSREDTLTCSETCRRKVYQFRTRFGWAPDDPPGPITVGAAIEVELCSLIHREQSRRAAAAAERAAYLARDRH